MFNRSFIGSLESALQNNPHCTAGLMANKRVFYTVSGPSGDKEILTLIRAGDPTEKYWYGHVVTHPNRNSYVAALVWTERFINADSADLLFRRFHYWIRVRLQYEPCTIQHDGEAYHRTESFDDAIVGLARIIDRFDPQKRWPSDEGPSAGKLELRILQIYGMENHADVNGCYPPVPMRTPLRIVGGHR